MNTRRPPSLQKMKKINILFILVLLVLATIFSSRFTGSTVAYQFDDTSMTLIGPGKETESIQIQYGEILSVTTISDFDLGENISGIDTANAQFGTWRNAEYGEYTLCAWPKSTAYILLETTDGIFVCSHENEESTLSMYESFLELLESKGYPAGSHS